jgi:uncharacterized protein (DUF1684 family)
MTTATTMYETDWQDWHAAREQVLTAPHGWLSLTSFHWLPDAPSHLDGLPGRFSVADGHAVLEASADDGYRVRAEDDDIPVDGVVRAEVAEAKSLEWLVLGDVVVELALRGGRYAIRTRNPQAPALRQFRGVPAFDLDENWVVDGTFEPFTEPRSIQVATARDDLVQYVTGVGTVSVDVAGTAAILIATAGAAGTLNIAFHDATNGDTTAPWRSVGTTAPDAQGRVRIDFNRAVNFPFAFSDCPAPPAGNSLPVPVTAGERTPLPAE